MRSMIRMMKGGDEKKLPGPTEAQEFYGGAHRSPGRLGTALLATRIPEKRLAPNPLAGPKEKGTDLAPQVWLQRG